MAQEIEGRVAQLLEGTNFVHVATVRQNGKPHIVPVWVDHDGEQVVLNTAEGRAWPANVRRNGNATLNVMNLENPYEYVEIEGSSPRTPTTARTSTSTSWPRSTWTKTSTRSARRTRSA